MTEPKWAGSTTTYSRAMSTATELAKEQPGAKAIQLADQIDHLVGYWVTDESGTRSVMSWPRPVALAAGQPGRHKGPR